MLPVDEGIAAVGRLTGLKEQRITARAHEGIGRCHDVHPEGRMLELAARHEHEHAGGDALGRAARTALMVIDEVCLAMDHGHPCAAHGVQARYRC